MSLNKYLMLIGGWTISSLAVPISLAIFPDVNYNFGIGYTITGVFYGLVLYLTLPEQFRPKLFALILSFAFGMFVGECAWNWFRYSVEFSSQLTGAFSLFTAALFSGYLAFGNKIAENSKDTQPGIAKIALSIAGILILARWLSSVIGDYIDGMFLYPVDINWENSTYLMLNLHYVLFAAFTVWFLVRAMKSLLAINMSKRNTTIMIITWIAGMVATSFACVYLEIEQGYDWGWSIGWLLGGIVIGLGMWLATKNSVSQSKFTYLVTSILVWGGGFFLCEKVSWQLQELFIQIFGEPLGRNIAINANVGIAGLVGGLVMFYHFETGRNIHINWKTVLATTLGFALGNALQGLIFYGKDDPVSNTIAAILWGTVSGAFLAVPSRNIKRFILLGFLGGAGIGLGYWIFTRAQTSFPILLGGFFGFSVGLATKNIQKALLLIFLSMIAFELRTEINSFIRESFDLSYNMRMTFNALTSLIIGLIIGLVWSSLKHQKSEETLE